MAQYYNNYPSTHGLPPPGPPPEPQFGGDGWTGCCIAISGVSQILLGILSIIFGVVMVSQGILGLVFQIYIPIWGGMVFLIAGAFGVMVVCCRKGAVNGDDFCEKCLASGYIGLSILAAILAIGQIGYEGFLSTAFALISDFYCENNFSGTAEGDIYISGLTCNDFNIVYYMRIASSAIAGIELVAAITGCCFGCYLSCCSPKEPVSNPMIVQPNGYPQSMNPYGQSTLPPALSPYDEYAKYAQYAESAAPYYNGYGGNPQVHYNGQNAMFLPKGYM